MKDSNIYLEPKKFLKLLEGVSLGDNYWLRNLQRAAELLVEIGYTQLMPVDVDLFGELADLRSQREAQSAAA